MSNIWATRARIGGKEWDKVSCVEHRGHVLRMTSERIIIIRVQVHCEIKEVR